MQKYEIQLAGTTLTLIIYKKKTRPRSTEVKGGEGFGIKFTSGEYLIQVATVQKSFENK